MKLPDLFTRAYLKSMYEVMGRNGFMAVLHLAKLSHYRDNQPQKLTVAEFVAINLAMEEMGGQVMGSGVNYRVGHATCSHLGQRISGVEDIPALLRPLADVVLLEDDILIENCPFCHTVQPNETRRHPFCRFLSGYVEESLNNTHQVQEIECRVQGSQVCRFNVRRK